MGCEVTSLISGRRDPRILTCDSEEYPLNLRRVCGHLTFVQAFIPARDVHDFQSVVIWVAKAQSDALIAAVSAATHRQKVDGVFFVVQPSHLQKEILLRNNHFEAVGAVGFLYSNKSLGRALQIQLTLKATWNTAK